MASDCIWMTQFCIRSLAVTLSVLTLVSACLARRIRKRTDKIIAEYEQNLKQIKIEIDNANKMLDEYEKTHQ